MAFRAEGLGRRASGPFLPRALLLGRGSRSWVHLALHTSFAYMQAPDSPTAPSFGHPEAIRRTSTTSLILMIQWDVLFASHT